jgi:hypothetical protein
MSNDTLPGGIGANTLSDADARAGDAPGTRPEALAAGAPAVPSPSLCTPTPARCGALMGCTPS